MLYKWLMSGDMLPETLRHLKHILERFESWRYASEDP